MYRLLVVEKDGTERTIPVASVGDGDGVALSVLEEPMVTVTLQRQSPDGTWGDYLWYDNDYDGVLE